MKLPRRISVLFFIGMFAAGSTALGYYYYFVYHPPLQAAEAFMRAMESGDAVAVQRTIVITPNAESGELREATAEEAHVLLNKRFQRGRIVDQRKREGGDRDYYYLVYRQPDAQIYALLATRVGEHYRIVVSERRTAAPERYLWEFTWTN